MILQRYAALGGYHFNLDVIDTEFVVVDDGQPENGLAKVDTNSFKKFFIATKNWDGNINPYDELGEPTEFGKQLFGVECLADCLRPGDFEPNEEVWLYAFDCEEGLWDLYTWIMKTSESPSPWTVRGQNKEKRNQQ